ncbi:probable CDP-diacylglycerol--inositol 3-phosphatidyltransferase 2 isoform X2 [Typha angustifolia]|uniref:probable CDP-diacylglycerol--inositol 3-phosphatidyltransferase 2 isoform X2 n=1 Tax=Typha angustifolia TaxID=59011 RepID=UPI003C2B099C
MAQTSHQKVPSVYLYIPNVIGYIRIIMNFVAFSVCYSRKWIFVILYFLSFFLDGLDGWFARKFNQVSTFGAVLDMVTDRVSTACLLTILSQLYSSFLSGKTSHKDVKDKSNWLLKAYYGHRPFMAFCCVGSEVLYIILYFIADKESESLLEVCLIALKQNSLLSFLFSLTLLGWGIKQVINIIQMKSAADACVLYDMKRSK